MKYQLSHKQTELIQLTGIPALGILSAVISLIFIKSLSIFLAGMAILVITFLTLLFSLRIYRAEFDSDFLYLTRRLKKFRISLKDVLKVSVFPIPVSLFFGQAYITSLYYTVNGIQHKAFIITRGSYKWSPTIDSIREIALLKQYMLEKKYSK